jgi:hypothetical protein
MPDPALEDHKAWLGYLQPEGLVVSAAALVDAQAILDRNAIEPWQAFKEHVASADIGDDRVDAIADFPAFLTGFLEWPEECVWGVGAGKAVPDCLTIPLREIEEVLEPTAAFGPPEDEKPTLLVKILPIETDLDAVTTGAAAGWSASASQRFERLLRETEVPIGLLTNGRRIRLIYAPRGESAGSLTFVVADMCKVAGRPLVAAFDMLLSCYRLLAAPTEAKLPALLARSREYQSRVSTALAGQVLGALYDLLRGFQAADGSEHGELLRAPVRDNPHDVYAGLLTVLMRLVFLLYAEDRGLMPGSALYVRNYSVHGLFERLRADAKRYPDVMDSRYGGWAQLVALFRAVHRGCLHPEMKMPARQGHLFDPNRYPFLEGATLAEPRLPLVSDGCLERVLRSLLILEGERLSYRTLDVEEIGSVYQTIMGFALEAVAGTSVAIAGKRKHKSEVPAPVVVDLEEIVALAPAERAKRLKERTGHEWEGALADGLRRAASADDLLVALEKRIARMATPHPVPAGGLVLQPTDERRRTGSHYTPRKLTAPIVKKTLEPILAALGPRPTPEQILDLKVCDLAMGSGAFLVEACRQLADVLVDAWAAHKRTPDIPPDEDELLHARRLIAQRCLYGVDKNPMAVDLAKLSLWLATLAKDHPFTFLDHSLRPGDSLVGLTRDQIIGFTWGTPDGKLVLGQETILERIELATKLRREILEGGDIETPEHKLERLRRADDGLNYVRSCGDLAIAAFFAGTKDAERVRLRTTYLDDLLRADGDGILKTTERRERLYHGEHPITPFHWEIEFPEVFGRASRGFDAIVGNPPFAGKNNLTGNNRSGFLDWLTTVHEESHGNSDLVAHFFRRAFTLLRPDGCFGLIATNTIGQGDTRSTGLRWICQHGGTIYSAQTRYRWPGQATVVVSVIHVQNGSRHGAPHLDGESVPVITAYLFHSGGHDDPARLRENGGKSFIGSYVLGMGFTFDDTDTKGVANPVSLMDELIARDSRNAQRVFPYIGGEEVNEGPTHAHHRFVINFGDMAYEQASMWPDLLRIVEERVRPARQSQGSIVNPARWWMHARSAADLYAAIAELDRVLVVSRVRATGFTYLPAKMVFSEQLVVFALPTFGAFAILQSRVHECWAYTFSGSALDLIRYAPTDCFETFPLPRTWLASRALDSAGKECFEFRADLMVRADEGLTKIYNRFHDPDERSTDILRLRELHSKMDRAVLDAFGWTDVPADCEFLLDYEDDEEEDEADGRARRRRKPWRYRWPDDVRDEVLARLLALNAVRAEEERLAGAAGANDKKKPGRAKTLPDGGLLAE